MSYCQGIGCHRQLNYSQIMKGYRFCGPCNRRDKGYFGPSYRTPAFTYTPSSHYTGVPAVKHSSYDDDTDYVSTFSLELEIRQFVETYMARMQASCGDNERAYMKKLRDLRRTLRALAALPGDHGGYEKPSPYESTTGVELDNTMLVRTVLDTVKAKLGGDSTQRYKAALEGMRDRFRELAAQ